MVNLANPFNKTLKSETAKEVADVVNTSFPTNKRIFRWEVTNARKAVEGSHKVLATAEQAIKSSEGAIPAATQETFDLAARQFNNDVSRLKYAHGKLGTSVKGMFQSFAETLGMDTTKWTSAKIKGSANEALSAAHGVKGNLIERTLSKPFRLAARFPKTSMVAGALLAVAGIGTVVKKRAARRTEEQAQAAMVDAQQQPLAQANTYQISPEEYAAMQARMKGGEGVPQTGHADGVIASRESGSQVMAPSV